MPKDYAKYRPSPSKQKSPQKRGRKQLFFLAVVICLLAAIFLGIVFSKNQTTSVTRQKMMSWIMDIRSHLSHKKSGASQLSQTSSTTQAKEEPEVRFNFYTELPNMQVTLPEDEKASSAPVPTAKTASTPSKDTLTKDKKAVPQYVLQLGVFKNESAAGQLRVSLLLAGCEADIVTTTEKDASILYHVQKGPFATLSQAKEAQKKLQNKGITGVVKQL